MGEAQQMQTGRRRWKNAEDPIFLRYNLQGSCCIFSHSSLIDWKRTEERYLSPKLGNTTWNAKGTTLAWSWRQCNAITLTEQVYICVIAYSCPCFHIHASTEYMCICTVYMNKLCTTILHNPSICDQICYSIWDSSA